MPTLLLKSLTNFLLLNTKEYFKECFTYFNVYNIIFQWDLKPLNSKKEINVMNRLKLRSLFNKSIHRLHKLCNILTNTKPHWFLACHMA